MHDETEHGNESSDVAGLATVPVPGLECWTVRLTVVHDDRPRHGWAPHVFWSAGAAETWLASRSRQLVRPAVRDCRHQGNGLAYAAVVDARGDELLVSEPLPRATATGLAALLAAELRAGS